VRSIRIDRVAPAEALPPIDPPWVGLDRPTVPPTLTSPASVSSMLSPSPSMAAPWELPSTATAPAPAPSSLASARSREITPNSGWRAAPPP